MSINLEYRRWYLIALTAIFLSVPGFSQTQFIGNDYFPAELEFRELSRVRLTQKIDDAKELPGIPGAALLKEVGFQHYQIRRYQTIDGSELSIEIVAAADEKAALSLLTLLRDSPISPGPPGDLFSSGTRELYFSKANHWVRIQGDNPSDLLRRIALSVGNRIPSREQQGPSLISHLPATGLDSASEKYFLDRKSFELSARPEGAALEFTPEMELAQANYTLQGQVGVLSLVSFPTAQMASDYFDRLSENLRTRTTEGSRLYTKRVGPLIGILEGTFDASNADKILGDIKFSYSIKWIYDKNNRSSATVWGVPVGILGTVVRSLLLTVLLCGMSVLLGVGMAAFRVLLRGFAPGNYLDSPERTEMTRLRLNEPTPLGNSGGNRQSKPK